MYLVDNETNEPIPMKSLHFKVNIIQSLASFEMEQHYVNVEDEALETIFMFPRDVDTIISQIKCEFFLADGKKKEMYTKIEDR
jgi:Vault protein inter-alpha-trypsin domain